MKPSKPNTFKDLDETFDTKKVTKALEENLRKIQTERPVPAVVMTEEDKAALHQKQAEAYNAEAIEGILHIARNSDQPRAFEVAGGLIKNLQDTAKDMLEIQEKSKRISASDPRAKQLGATGTTNNLFVGSTKELLRALKDENLKTIEGEVE
jgi:hypothetical protein